MKLFTLILFIGAFYSFAPGDNKVFETSKWLPDGLDTRHNVLLVVNFKMGTNKNAARACEKANSELREYMQGNYPYKYEFVDWTDLQSNAKYADKDKYRYAVVDRNGTLVNGDMRQPLNVYHIYDRKTDKHYPATSKPNSFLLPVFRPTIDAMVTYLKSIKGTAKE